MSLAHFDEKNFAKEIASHPVVLVDFWAEWCVPCKMLTPVLEELAKEYDGKIKIGKVNIDHNHRLATQYGIMSIPTLIFFKNGQISDQAAGVLTKPQLKKKIDSVL